MRLLAVVSMDQIDCELRDAAERSDHAVWFLTEGRFLQGALLLVTFRFTIPFARLLQAEVQSCKYSLATVLEIELRR